MAGCFTNEDETGFIAQDFLSKRLMRVKAIAQKDRLEIFYRRHMLVQPAIGR